MYKRTPSDISRLKIGFRNLCLELPKEAAAYFRPTIESVTSLINDFEELQKIADRRLDLLRAVSVDALGGTPDLFEPSGGWDVFFESVEKELHVNYKDTQCDQHELEQLHDYKEHHEFVVKMLKEILGINLDTLGDLVYRLTQDRI